MGCDPLEPCLLKFKTRTPIWTGDAKKECLKLHETSLIGSLRWWFEIVVRGLGGRACDPTAKGEADEGNACSFDAEKYEKAWRNGQGSLPAAALAGLCPACQVFGATGWRKIFRLEVDNSDLCPTMDGPSRGLLIPSGRCTGSRMGGWYVLPAQHGRFAVRLHLAREYEGEWYLPVLITTLKLMEHWGAIGAKETGGYGVFSLTDVPEYLLTEENPFAHSQEEHDTLLTTKHWDCLPGLTDFFFAKVKLRPQKEKWWQGFKEVELALAPDPPCYDQKQRRIDKKQLQAWIKAEAFPLSPIMRNWLRYTWFRRMESSPNEAMLFGTSTGDQRRRAVIGISHAYQTSDKLWEFRIWGHRPSGLNESVWKEFVAGLRQVMGEVPHGQRATLPVNEPPSIWDAQRWGQQGRGWYNQGGLFGGLLEPAGFSWREFNSDRDTVGKLSNPWEFLKSLARGEERRND